MEYIIALYVFGIMFAFLWDMKADLFLAVFWFAAYGFFLFFVLIADPIAIIQSIWFFSTTNPLLGILILISPLGIHYLIIFLKKIRKRYDQKKIQN